MGKKRIQLENRDVFLARLTSARKKTGKTQEEVAQILNISQATYGRWENGIDEIPIGAVPRLAEIYGKSIDWLLAGTVDKTAPWLQALAPLRLLLDQLDEAGATTLAKAVEICLEMKGLKMEEPPSNQKETNPIARRGRRAAGGT